MFFVNNSNSSWCRDLSVADGRARAGFVSLANDPGKLIKSQAFEGISQALELLLDPMCNSRLCMMSRRIFS